MESSPSSIDYKSQEKNIGKNWIAHIPDGVILQTKSRKKTELGRFMFRN